MGSGPSSARGPSAIQSFTAASEAVVATSIG